MVTNKSYCPTHHLYYKGTVCPFCQSEKYERFTRTNKKPTEKEEISNKAKQEPVEITEDVIAKLQAHFAK